MEVQVNGTKIFQLESWEKDVIKNDISEDDFDADMKRRLEWVLKHKAEQCYMRFEKDWLEKLRKDPAVTSVPTDKAAFVALVKSRPDYQDRKARDVAAKALQGA